MEAGPCQGFRSLPTNRGVEGLEHRITALLTPGPGELARAGWGALEAAWALEAEGQDEEARRCRQRALELWALAEHAGEEVAELSFPASQLILAEVMRRCGRFEEARSRCHRGLSGRPREPLRSLLEYELELITAADSSAGTLPDGL